MDALLLVGFAAGGALAPAGILALRRLARERRYHREACRIDRDLARPLPRLEREETAWHLHDRVDRLLRAGRIDRAQHEALDRRIAHLAAAKGPHLADAANRALPAAQP